MEKTLYFVGDPHFYMFIPVFEAVIDNLFNSGNRSIISYLYLIASFDNVLDSFHIKLERNKPVVCT